MATQLLSVAFKFNNMCNFGKAEPIKHDCIYRRFVICGQYVCHWGQRWVDQLVNGRLHPRVELTAIDWGWNTITSASDVIKASFFAVCGLITNSMDVCRADRHWKWKTIKQLGIIYTGPKDKSVLILYVKSISSHNQAKVHLLPDQTVNNARPS